MYRARVLVALTSRSARRSGETGWGCGRPREVEAVRHVVGCGIARVQRFHAERRLAELQQADVGVEHVGDVALLRVGSEHEAADPGAVAELRSVLPVLGDGWVDV